MTWGIENGIFSWNSIEIVFIIIIVLIATVNDLKNFLNNVLYGKKYPYRFLCWKHRTISILLLQMTHNVESMSICRRFNTVWQLLYIRNRKQDSRNFTHSWPKTVTIYRLQKSHKICIWIIIKKETFLPHKC